MRLTHGARTDKKSWPRLSKHTDIKYLEDQQAASIVYEEDDEVGIRWTVPVPSFDYYLRFRKRLEVACNDPSTRGGGTKDLAFIIWKIIPEVLQEMSREAEMERRNEKIMPLPGIGVFMC